MLKLIKSKDKCISTLIILILISMMFTNISYGDKNDDFLYKPLIITGNMIGESQVYSIKDIRELSSFKELDIKDGSMIKLNSFLELCGLEKNASEDTIIQIFYKNNTIPIETYKLKEIKELNALLDVEREFVFLIEDKEIPIKKIMVSQRDDTEDPWYQHHNGDLYSDMKNIEFSVNIYDNNDKSNDKKPVKTKTFTTKEIEKIMKENPEYVAGNYYGTIGNKESIESMGAGGWIDYFEGIDLWWLLHEKVGVPEVSGTAIYYGRDNEEYTKTTMEYLQNKNSDDDKYTVITRDGYEIKGSKPMLATSKNGYPLLPEHDHDSTAYKDYNKLNDNLKEKGIDTKIGLVKNHSGPFVAGLGNLEGQYGGYRVETGGDCVRIDLHLDLLDKNLDGSKEQVDQVSFKDYSIRTYNEGITERNQTIELRVNFTDTITVNENAASDFYSTISGQEMFDKIINKDGTEGPSKRTLSVKRNPNDDKQLIMTITITEGYEDLNAQFNGNLIIKAKNGALKNILDKDRKPVKWEDIDCVIPTGVAISTKTSKIGTDKEPAYIVKKVDNRSNVRAMVHMNVVSNGQPILSADDIYGVGNYVVHAHFFVDYQKDNYVKLIVDGFNAAIKSEGLEDKYIAEYKEGSTEFTIRALDPKAGEELDVQIFEWTDRTELKSMMEIGKKYIKEEGSSENNKLLVEKIEEADDLIKNQKATYLQIDKIKNDIEKIIIELYGEDEINLEKNKIRFTDVDDTNWAAKSIYNLVEAGIVSGKTKNIFAPNDKVTRAELVKVLAFMSGEDLNKYTESKFDDVKDEWFAKYVVWANEKGIVFGSNGKFNPNATVTREDMAVMIYIYNEIINKSTLPKKEDSKIFSDDRDISNYAREAILGLQQSKIISGKENNKLSPKSSATRSEMAQIVSNFLQESIILEN